MNVTVTIVGPQPQDILNIVTQVHSRVGKGIADIAKESREYMVNIIRQNKKRAGSAGLLEETIKVEEGKSTGIFGDKVVGVGNIAELNQYTPYWALLNYGGMVPMRAQVVPGYFNGNLPPLGGLAGTGIGTEQFFHVPKGSSSTLTGKSYLMIVDSPIKAVNYIEKTKAHLSTIMGSKFTEMTKVVGMKNLGAITSIAK